MIALCKGRGNFTNAFSSNLNTINPKVCFKCCVMFIFTDVDPGLGY